MPVYRNIRAIKLPITGDMIANRTITGDKIAWKTLYADHLVEDTVAFRCVLLQIEPKAGLIADSTGVKARSPTYTFRAYGVKSLILRCAVTSIPSDAVVRVGAYNLTKGDWIVYRDFEGATGEDLLYSGAIPDLGDDIELRAEVTTASATSGATFDLGYALLAVDYGFS